MRGIHRRADRQPQEYGYDIDQRSPGGFTKPFGHAAFAEQVTEHQHPDQRGAGRDSQ